MKTFRSLFPVIAALALLAPCLGSGPLGAGEAQKFEKSYAFQGDKDIKVGIKVGDCTIDYFKIRNWPDPDDFRKAEKDLNDRHTMEIEFHYSNRDLDNDYKCHYTVTIPGGKDGKPFGEDSRTATLDKGKVDDTNRMSLKIRTNEYRQAKTIKVSFEIWKKS
jgi:hypothetical protein